MKNKEGPVRVDTIMCCPWAFQSSKGFNWESVITKVWNKLTRTDQIRIKKKLYVQLRDMLSLKCSVLCLANVDRRDESGTVC